MTGRCRVCLTSLRPGAKHCTQCGAVVLPDEKPTGQRCKKCYGPMLPTDKFCRKCGEVAGATGAQKDAPIRCACGRTLPKGDKFCRSCGRSAPGSGASGSGTRTSSSSSNGYTSGSSSARSSSSYTPPPPPPPPPPVDEIATKIDEDTIRKVSALLARAEGTTFPNEAMVAETKVAEILGRYGITVNKFKIWLAEKS